MKTFKRRGPKSWRSQRVSRRQCALMHGMAALELAGGFRLQDVDETFRRLLDAYLASRDGVLR